MNEVLHLKENTLGRDIIVNDIHGNFHLLKRGLKKLKFDPTKDRLILVGDLVDRGKNSPIAEEWIKKDYVFSVIGNHDAMFCFKDDMDKFKESLICFPIDTWYTDMDENKFNALCKTFRERLYPAIEIETKNGLVAVTHAEIPKGFTWVETKEKIEKKDYDFIRNLFWNREIAKIAIRNQEYIDDFKSEYFIKDIAYSFHGHSMAKKLNYKPFHISNRYYIDTGSYKDKENSGMSFFDITQPKKRLLLIKN